MRSPAIARALSDHEDAVLLAVGMSLFVGVGIARLQFPHPADAVTLFSVIPVALFGVVFGLRGGVGAAALATFSFVLWAVLEHVDIEPIGYLTRATAMLVAGATVGYLSDISYRSVAAARSSSDQLQMVLRSADALVYVKDRGGSFRLLSDQLPSEGHALEGLSPGEPFFLPPPLSDDFASHDRRAMEEGDVIAVEENASRADGLHSYISTKYPLFDDDGIATGVCSVSTDVTAEKLIDELAVARKELGARALELERSNSELAHFAYAAAHDLSEPLRTVSGYLELLARRHGENLNADADEFLRIAVHGTKRMQALIEGLLDYSKLDHGELRATKVDCSALVDEVLESIRLVIAETGATLHTEFLPTIKGDPAQLGSLFQNLISNALKFVEGRPPAIDISASREVDAWRFSISDNGIGIDPDKASEAFGMFRRLHGSHEYGGSGIGLALCKRIVERHGGRIWVESVPGVGSKFIFTIADLVPASPLPPDPPASADVSTIAPRGPDPTQNGAGPTDLDASTATPTALAAHATTKAAAQTKEPIQPVASSDRGSSGKLKSIRAVPGAALGVGSNVLRLHGHSWGGRISLGGIRGWGMKLSLRTASRLSPVPFDHASGTMPPQLSELPQLDQPHQPPLLPEVPPLPELAQENPRDAGLLLAKALMQSAGSGSDARN